MGHAARLENVADGWVNGKQSQPPRGLLLQLRKEGMTHVRLPVPAEHIDAVKASPANFRLLLENEHVRVVEYALRAGERDQWHTHPPKVSYVASGGTLRITTEDGQSFLTDEKAGSATWMDTLGRHFAQNVGKTPVRIVLIEVKGAS